MMHNLPKEEQWKYYIKMKMKDVNLQEIVDKILHRNINIS